MERLHVVFRHDFSDEVLADCLMTHVPRTGETVSLVIGGVRLPAFRVKYVAHSIEMGNISGTNLVHSAEVWVK